MAIEAFALANSLLAGWMEGEAQMSKLVTSICSIPDAESVRSSTSSGSMTGTVRQAEGSAELGKQDDKVY